jgi:hemerythrin-like domain-containing protein
MTDEQRLIAWNRELLAAHRKLRDGWELARDAVPEHADGANGIAARRELILYCKGFCVALTGHHVGEDTALFPELARRFPALRPTLAKLEQDHAMIATLVAELERAVDTGAPPARLAAHLEGLAAIMDSHFGFEERRLLDLLADLELDADVETVLGPL